MAQGKITVEIKNVAGPKINAVLSVLEKQRFEALKNALKTVEAFCIPSLSPDQFDKFDDVKAVLLKRYKPKRRKI